MLAYLLRLTAVIAFIEVKNTYAESHHISKRIVLGTDVDIKSVPWEVSLHKRGRPGLFTFICGAAIVGPNEVLTAGHCIGNGSRTDYFIRAGSTSKYIGGTVHNVEYIDVYPGYQGTSCQIKHDLAFIRPYYEKYPSYSDTLKYIQISVWHKHVCYRNFGIPDILAYEDDMLCISNSKNGTFEAICDGDSGSPVVRNNRLAGVVSAYISDQVRLPPDRFCGPLTEKEKELMVCNHLKTVGVYNSIVPHRDWVYKNLIKSRGKTKAGYFCLDGCF